MKRAGENPRSKDLIIKRNHVHRSIYMFIRPSQTVPTATIFECSRRTLGLPGFGRRLLALIEEVRVGSALECSIVRTDSGILPEFDAKTHG